MDIGNDKREFPFYLALNNERTTGLILKAYTTFLKTGKVVGEDQSLEAMPDAGEITDFSQDGGHFAGSDGSDFAFIT